MLLISGKHLQETMSLNHAPYLQRPIQPLLRFQSPDCRDEGQAHQDTGPWDKCTCRNPHLIRRRHQRTCTTMEPTGYVSHGSSHILKRHKQKLDSHVMQLLLFLVNTLSDESAKRTCRNKVAQPMQPETSSSLVEIALQRHANKERQCGELMFLTVKHAKQTRLRFRQLQAAVLHSCSPLFRFLN